MAVTNNENNFPPDHATMLNTRQSSPRKVLGQLSTNLQPSNVSAHASEKESQQSTPLKRSFKSAIEDDGFRYLKRRRVSSTSPSSDVVHWTTRPSPGRSAESTSAVRHKSSISGTTQADMNEGLQADERDNDRESSSERHSFSSLINYDPSSQTGPSSQSRARAATPETTRTTLSEATMSRAELLRMQLQIAMYKVRTKQTTVPFDYLREDTPAGSRESSKAVQEAVEQLRQEAYVRLSFGQRPRTSLSPPLPSEPMLSLHRKQLDNQADRLILTPAPARYSNTSPSKRLQSVPDLTSSAVKGQVAEGLLGLKHGF